MAVDLVKSALEHGFDQAYLMPEIFVENANRHGLKTLAQILPEAKSVLLLIKKHNPYKPFPEGAMEVHSHYPAYQSAYLLHKSLSEKLTGMGVKAKSADMLALKPYAAAAGLSKLKNSLTYSKTFGSYFVLQAIATDAEPVESAKAQSEDLCKDCEMCVNACPMGAISKQGGVDIEKCVRNHVPVREMISDDIKRAAKRGYIGCGICQAVCPLNKHVDKIQPAKELVEALDLAEFLDIESGREHIKKLRELIGKNEVRAGRALATACMIAGNLGDEKYLPYLKHISQNHDNILVAEYAKWAFEKISEN